MQREKLASYIGLAINGGYVIIGSDKLGSYSKKLYLVLIDANAGKSARKVYEKLTESGIKGLEVENLDALNGKTYHIIGIKNLGLAEQIKKQIEGE